MSGAEPEDPSRRRPPPSKSLIVDIYGAYVRSMGGWLAVAHLISLMEDLGVDEQAVRSTVSRISRRGVLVRERRGRQVGYRLSPVGEAILEEGDERMFAVRRPPALHDGWVLAVFSVPEERRGMRHQLRSRLSFLGFGSLGGGVWMAPAQALERARSAVGSLGLQAQVDLFTAQYAAFDDIAAVVRRCWDVDALQARYAAFIEEVEPVVEHWRSRPGRGRDRNRAAFVDYTLALHQWRKLPYLDPGLPRELLPEPWNGTRAAQLFGDLVGRTEKPARLHVEAVVSG